MDLNMLDTFCQVVRQGTFSAAARELLVSPSHVSRQIAALEAQMQVRLFERTTRQMSLTEAGRMLHHRVEPLLAELRETAERVGEQSRIARGVLRVAAPTAFCQEQLVHWLPAFHRRYPALTLQLILDPKANDLIEEGIDLALRLGPVASDGLIAVSLCPMARYVVAAPEYLERRGTPVCPSDIVGHDCLTFPFFGASGVWHFLDAQGKTEQVRPRSVVEVAEGITLRELAIKGMGLTLLPDWLAHKALKEGTLSRVFTQHSVTGTVHDAKIWMAYPSRAHLPLKTRVFIDHLRDLFHAGPPWASD